MICPLREIVYALWLFRPAGFTNDKRLENAECIKKDCEWFNKDTNKCSVNTASKSSILND